MNKKTTWGVKAPSKTKKPTTKAAYLKAMRAKQPKRLKGNTPFILKTVDVREHVKGLNLEQSFNLLSELSEEITNKQKVKIEAVVKKRPELKGLLETKKLKEEGATGHSNRISEADALKAGLEFTKDWGIGLILIAADNRKDPDEIESMRVAAVGLKEGVLMNALLNVIQDAVMSEEDIKIRVLKMKSIKDGFEHMEAHVLQSCLKGMLENGCK